MRGEERLRILTLKICPRSKYSTMLVYAWHINVQGQFLFCFSIQCLWSIKYIARFLSTKLPYPEQFAQTSLVNCGMVRKIYTRRSINMSGGALLFKLFMFENAYLTGFIIWHWHIFNNPRGRAQNFLNITRPKPSVGLASRTWWLARESWDEFTQNNVIIIP